MKIFRVIPAFALSLVLGAGTAEAQASPQPATPPAPQPATRDLPVGEAPPPPPGTEKVLSFDRRGDLIAACAQKKAAANQSGAPATEVWVTDGRDVWKTGSVMGACDPAWSPDGARLAVAAPDGIWLLSGKQQQQGERLTDVRAADVASSESGRVAFAKPRWSPDGAYVAALVTDDGATWVEVLEVATGKRTFKSASNVTTFEWCKDARSLDIGGQCVSIVQQ